MQLIFHFRITSYYDFVYLQYFNKNRKYLF
nr:MAG TPA: hypothetical protein [Caudoviricetes sp.]